MTINEEGILLRIFIGDSDRVQGVSLSRAIVQKTRELGLAGATVLHGREGYGAHSRIHTDMTEVLSVDLPVVIEIVDTEEKITQLLPSLQDLVQEGMITMEHVHVLMYRHAPGDAIQKGG